MRQMLSGLIAAIAVISVSAGSAMACGGLIGSGCAPCGQAWVSPCGQGYVQAYSYHQHLTDPDALFAPPASRYFYANQGPTFSGPGMWAPEPTYRWRHYARPGVHYRYRSHRAYRGHHHAHHRAHRHMHQH